MNADSEGCRRVDQGYSKLLFCEHHVVLENDPLLFENFLGCIRIPQNGLFGFSKIVWHEVGIDVLVLLQVEVSQYVWLIDRHAHILATGIDQSDRDCF